jgi:hypothetical protein
VGLIAPKSQLANVIFEAIFNIGQPFFTFFVKTNVSNYENYYISSDKKRAATIDFSLP